MAGELFHSHDLFMRGNFFLYWSCNSSTPTKQDLRHKLERGRWVAHNNVLRKSRNCLPCPLPIKFHTGSGLALYYQPPLPPPPTPPPPPFPNFLHGRCHIDCNTNDVCKSSRLCLTVSSLGFSLSLEVLLNKLKSAAV